jgi:hypothetical protein
MFSPTTVLPARRRGCIVTAGILLKGRGIMLGAIHPLTVVVYGVLAVYLAAWLVLLIGCVRRKRFWPVVGGQRATKWLPWRWG